MKYILITFILATFSLAIGQQRNEKQPEETASAAASPANEFEYDYGFDYSYGFSYDHPLIDWGLMSSALPILASILVLARRARNGSGKFVSAISFPTFTGATIFLVGASALYLAGQEFYPTFMRIIGGTVNGLLLAVPFSVIAWFVVPPRRA